jgi:signal transduction histidine kinase
LASVRGSRAALLGLLLACGLLAVAAGVLVARQLDQPLKILAAAVSHFGDGDLTDPLPRSRIAEVALLAGNFGAMREALARRTTDLEQAEAEARRAEAELRQLNLVLEQRVVERTTALELASKHKSDFLTSMSHELRTPLNAIIGFSEIMLDHDVTEIPDDQRKTFLAHIQGGGHHLLGLVNDILDLAKVEAGHMELSVERVPLHEMMVGCVDVIRGMADPKLLTVVAHCEPADAVVSADPVRLKQILYNLLSNAVKFTPTGGQISVSARVDSTEAVIAVRDSGIGIRAEDTGLIFEPFRQAKVVIPPRQEGTGLGLPLVRELVGLHGGRVWLDSAPGAGSCFTFTLPHALDLGEPAKPEALALAS